MNFYLYDKVVIYNGVSTCTYTRSDYSALGLYYYDNRQEVRFKVDYCLLRPGHFVSVCTGADYLQDFGVLVTMLHHNEEIFLAYKRPESTVVEDSPGLFLRRFKVSQAINEDILFLVPANSFLKRKYLYAVDGGYSEVIW